MKPGPGRAWPLLLPDAAWFLLLFVLPLAGIVVVSFWTVADYQLLPDRSLAAWRHVLQPLYLTVLLRTLRVAGQVTVLTALIGYPVAYYLARHARRSRVLLLSLVALPLWTSYLVRSFAWLLILGLNGVVNYALQRLGLIAAPLRWLLYSEFAVTVALVHVYLPLFVLPVFAVLEKLDQRLLEASRDLGASEWRTFCAVTLPLSAPGIASGCLFVFIPAVGAYVTPELLGGTNAVMLGSLVAQQFGDTFQYPFGAALALTLMLVILGVAALVLRLGRART